jgi:ribosomal protein S18 acetylase RimI-like enzyme
MIRIRPYDPGQDEADLRTCVMELQDAERAIEPAMPPGERMVDAYLELLHASCQRYDGRIFVAEDAEAQRLAGYIVVLATVASEEPDDDPTPYSYLSDLLVREPYRGRGLARDLVQTGEAFVRERGATRMRLQVLAENRAARGLYAKHGYRDHIVELEKRLGPDAEKSAPR